MNDKEKLIEFMHNMAKKGFYDILEHVINSDGLHYNEIQSYAWKNKIVYSRASVTTMLNWMVSFELLERRIVANARPIRTIYTASKKGLEAMNKINNLNV